MKPPRPPAGSHAADQRPDLPVERHTGGETYCQILHNVDPQTPQLPRGRKWGSSGQSRSLLGHLRGETVPGQHRGRASSAQYCKPQPHGASNSARMGLRSGWCRWSVAEFLDGALQGRGAVGRRGATKVDKSRHRRDVPGGITEGPCGLSGLRCGLVWLWRLVT